MSHSKRVGNIEITLPDILEYEGGQEVSAEDINIRPIHDPEEHDQILGFELIADVENAGTVINTVIIESRYGYSEPEVSAGAYNDNSDSQNPDDWPDDTINPLTEETADQIIITDHTIY